MAGYLGLDRHRIQVVHHPRHKLGEHMNKEAAETLQESDLILWMVDASQEPQADDQLTAIC